MELFLLHLLNGLQLSMLLFLLAVGLTLIFGLMDTLNLAHGAFYTIGAYTGYWVASSFGNFWWALVIGPLPAFAIGALLQYFVLQPLALRGRSTHLDLALLTFGLLFVTMGLADLVSGAGFQTIRVPEALEGGVRLLGVHYPVYRLFVIAAGFALAAVLWLALERTVIGAVVRAGVDNRDMVIGMGINIGLVFALVFGLGAALAALSGVIAAPIFSIYSRMGVSILIETFIVVILGGLGNFRGSFYGALVVGVVDTLAKAYVPSGELFAIYIVLALVLVFRPQGLFGTRRQAA